jgi:hypothetical protein
MPNDGFLRQLLRFEQAIRGYNTMVWFGYSPVQVRAGKTGFQDLEPEEIARQRLALTEKRLPDEVLMHDDILDAVVLTRKKGGCVVI